MKFRSFEISGPLEIIPHRISDGRGYFSEVFRLGPFADLAGKVEFVQENESLSVEAGTIRGLHFQTAPCAQGKLVRCTNGAIFDVAVDLRHDGPTFGRWIGVMLTAEQGNQLWIPPGFAHGFCTTQRNCVVNYKVTSYYSPENDCGVAWDDPMIDVQWPMQADAETLSNKDRAQPRLADLPTFFSMAG